MKWYYADGGRQVGPMEESALDDLVRAGVVRDETLVWREGMAGWQPLSAAHPRPAPPPPAAPAPAPAYSAPAYQAPAYQAQGPAPAYSAPAYTAPAAAPMGTAQSYCVECGRPYAASELVSIGGAPVCAVCKPLYMQRMRESGQTAGQVRYAGFWIRFVARVIDAVLLGVVGMIIRLPLMMVFGLGGLGARGIGALAVAPAMIGLVGLLTLINIALAVGYEVYFVSTKGGTIGKLVLGLKIVRADGGPVSPGLALGRYFAQWISAIILMIGYIMAGFDPQKRALHDRICNTFVIYSK